MHTGVGWKHTYIKGRSSLDLCNAFASSQSHGFQNKSTVRDVYVEVWFEKRICHCLCVSVLVCVCMCASVLVCVLKLWTCLQVFWSSAESECNFGCSVITELLQGGVITHHNAASVSSSLCGLSSHVIHLWVCVSVFVCGSFSACPEVTWAADLSSDWLKVSLKNRFSLKSLQSAGREASEELLHPGVQVHSKYCKDCSVFYQSIRQYFRKD